MNRKKIQALRDEAKRLENEAIFALDGVVVLGFTLFCNRVNDTYRLRASKRLKNERCQLSLGRMTSLIEIEKEIVRRLKGTKYDELGFLLGES